MGDMIIDTTPTPKQYAQKSADLVIEINVSADGRDTTYDITYGTPEGKTFELLGVTRAYALKEHIRMIQTNKPRTVVVRSGGSPDISLPQDSINNIISGELGLDELLVE